MSGTSRGLRWRAAAMAGVLVLPLAMASGLMAPANARGAKESRTFFADFYPPSPFEQVLKQPDGTGFKARLSPGEVGGLFETLDGYSVARGKDNVWRYVSGRGEDGLLFTNAIVGKNAVPAGLKPQAGRRANVFLDPQGYDMRTAMFRQLQIASRKAQMQAAAEGEPRIFRFPVLMLATWWHAEEGQTEPQFQDGSNTPEHFKAILDGFGGNETGTLTEFYWEDSFGQFLVQVDVHGPYVSNRSREDRCYYGGIETSTAGGDLDLIDDVLGIGGGGALGMAGEAVPQADPLVDFSQYDNDGDRIVDFVGLIHSGPDMAVTGNPCHTWSHAIQMTLGAADGVGMPTNDGVFVDRLFTMPEFDNVGSQLNIGVATHEMLHALGEPDYYNTSYSSAGTGDWDIMSGGSYLGNPPGSNPSGFNPATRVFQGWLTPTVVQADTRGITLTPRNIKPPGYTVEQPAPNLLMVPIAEIAPGETDDTGYEWTEDDVYGLPKNPATDKYIIEGYYIENMSRTVNAPAIHPEMSRAPYFDRRLLGSGLMVWHFDYWLRSNIIHGSNNAQTDPNRPQMDPMEFDFNDNTQELQLGKGRGNAEDLLFSAATGITSGTRMLQPGFPSVAGEPQDKITFSGASIGTVNGDHKFTVEDNPNNYLLRARVRGTGDCKLQLFYADGSQATGEADSGGVGDEELVQLVEPVPGEYTARVSDFAGCANYEGSIEFLSTAGFLPTKGAADTWSNWTQKPTGWAITNVGPDLADGLDHSADAGGTESITFDILNIGATETDVSPGFVTGDMNDLGGFGAINAGRANTLTVPVFNNGGKAATASVVVRRDSATGPVVYSGVVNVPAYTRTYVDFTFDPGKEGYFHLYTQVDPGNGLTEAHEGNNTQRTMLWSGPASPRVLVVDDDGALDSEETFTGALAALGVPYAVVSEHPTAAVMKQYEAVLWEAGGERDKGQLDRDDRAAVREYLDSGGKMLLSSPRIVNAMGALVSRTSPDATVEAQDTLKQYFGADVFVTSVNLRQGPVVNNDDLQVVGTGSIFGTRTGTITQFSGRHVIDVMKVADYEGEGAPEQIGEVQPALKLAEAPEGQFLGMRVKGDAAHKSFKTVLLGYNLAQHTKPDEYVEMVESVLEFFEVPLGTYKVQTAEPVIYHSAVRDQVSSRTTYIRAVVLGGKPNQPVTLYYRRHGKGGYYEQPMRPGEYPGTYLGAIPPVAVTPDGVDYYIKAGTDSTYSPPSAWTGQIAHAIGVALPESLNPIAILPGGPPTGQPPAEEPPTQQPPTAQPPKRPLPTTGAGTAGALLAAVLVGSALLVRKYTFQP